MSAKLLRRDKKEWTLKINQGDDSDTNYWLCIHKLLFNNEFTSNTDVGSLKSKLGLIWYLFIGPRWPVGC